MRILNVVCSTNPVLGGVIEWVRQYGLAAEDLDHTIHIACFDNPGSPWINDIRLKVYTFEQKFRYFYSRDFVSWLKSNSNNYDAVIAHGLWRYASFGTWRALHSSKTPYFVYTHGMLDPWFNHAYPLKRFLKMLYWPFTDFKVLRDAKGVFFTCEREHSKAQSSFKPFKARPLITPIGISEPTGSAEYQRNLFFNEYPQTQNKRNILFLGRIHPKKGCDLLTKAFSQLACDINDIHLIMAGPGDPAYISSLKNTIEDPKIQDRITWTGMISGDLKWGAYHVSDAFILPSHQENFGIAVVEALACGVPVLISDKVDIWQEIDEYGAAMLMRDCSESIYTALNNWFALDPEICDKMAENARRCYVDLFEVKSATTRLLEKIKENLPDGSDI